MKNQNVCDFCQEWVPDKPQHSLSGPEAGAIYTIQIRSQRSFVDGVGVDKTAMESKELDLCTSCFNSLQKIVSEGRASVNDFVAGRFYYAQRVEEEIRKTNGSLVKLEERLARLYFEEKKPWWNRLIPRRFRHER